MLKFHTQVSIQPHVVPETASVQVLVESLAQTSLETAVQEYISLYQKCEQYGVKAILKRMEEIRKELQLIANAEYKDGEPVIFTSAAGTLEFSPRQEVTEILDPLDLLWDLEKKFGLAVARSVVTIALTPLRQVLSELELKEYAEKKQTGPRTLKSVKPT